jgi:hypothetical protein
MISRRAFLATVTGGLLLAPLDFLNLDGLLLEDLGLQHLRGRAAPMRVYAISPKPLTTDQTTGG